jgi:hypothetical protein
MSSIDISEWGQPSASYPACGCDIPRFFTAQQLVFDITLCGVWYATFLNPAMFDVHEASLFRAGVPTVYNPQCFNSGPTGRCVRVPLLDRMNFFFFFFFKSTMAYVLHSTTTTWLDQGRPSTTTRTLRLITCGLTRRVGPRRLR